MLRLALESDAASGSFPEPSTKLRGLQPRQPEDHNAVQISRAKAKSKAGGPSLADLAARIRDKHQAAAAALKNAVAHAISAGNLLLEAKKQMNHGEWLPWLQDNCDIPERTAQAYMRLARMPLEKRNAVADLPLREALSAIRSRERSLADAAAREAAPRPGPAQLCTTTSAGEVLFGAEAIAHIKTLTAPPPSPPPPTNDELADDLMRQASQVCATWHRQIPVSVLRDAFERQFGEQLWPETFIEWKQVIIVSIERAWNELPADDWTKLRAVLLGTLNGLDKDDESIPPFLRREAAE